MALPCRLRLRLGLTLTAMPNDVEGLWLYAVLDILPLPDYVTPQDTTVVDLLRQPQLMVIPGGMNMLDRRSSTNLADGPIHSQSAPWPPGS